MEVLLIALAIVAVLIVAAGIGIGVGVARRGLHGGNEPPALPPPEPGIRFRKQTPERRFVKRVPPPPPVKKEMGQKPLQGNGGKLRPKELNLDFNLPCPVMARARGECPCPTCRGLRKKFGV